MSAIDDILNRFNLKYEDLKESEREVLNGWLKVLDSNQLDVEQVRIFVHTLRKEIETQLVQYKETPSGWVSIFAMFIPFYGLLTKWYQDQNRIGLEMRLRNILLIEDFLTGPQRARDALNRQIASLVSNVKQSP